MTLDVGTSYLYVVKSQKCMQLSVLQSHFRGLSCTNTMTRKWTNLKAATAFKNCLCISNRLVVERVAALLRVVRKK